MLEIDVSRDDGDTRVISFLSGEFDISEKERVDRFLTTAVSTELRALVVDLSGVSFLDSSAVGLLISHATKLQEFDARLCIVVGSNDYLVKKFSHLGIFNNTGIQIFDSLTEAESAITGL